MGVFAGSARRLSFLPFSRSQSARSAAIHPLGLDLHDLDLNDLRRKTIHILDECHPDLGSRFSWRETRHLQPVETNGPIVAYLLWRQFKISRFFIRPGTLLSTD